MTDEQNEVNKIFQFIDTTTSELRDDLNSSYSDALAENLSNILDQKSYVNNGFPNEKQTKSLNKQYSDFSLKDYGLHDVKKAIELAIIKAQRQDKVDVNHLMTPDVIGSLTALMVLAIFKNYPNKKLRVIDPAVGTSNLLYETAIELKPNKINLQLSGIDNDESQLQIADSFANAINEEIDLYHQDAIASWLKSDYDLAISDLPVGYYPIDENTNTFATRADKGHSYAHHLLIEQTMNNLHPNGVAMFIVPSQIFQTDQAKKLVDWMAKDEYLQAVLSLPESLFASEAAAKSIIVLQKHGNISKQSPNILMGQMPEMNNEADVQSFKDQLQTWSNQTFGWGK